MRCLHASKWMDRYFSVTSLKTVRLSVTKIWSTSETEEGLEGLTARTSGAHSSGLCILSYMLTGENTQANIKAHLQGNLKLCNKAVESRRSRTSADPGCQPMWEGKVSSTVMDSWMPEVALLIFSWLPMTMTTMIAPFLLAQLYIECLLKAKQYGTMIGRQDIATSKTSPTFLAHYPCKEMYLMSYSMGMRSTHTHTVKPMYWSHSDLNSQGEFTSSHHTVYLNLWFLTCSKKHIGVTRADFKNIISTFM